MDPAVVAASVFIMHSRDGRNWGSGSGTCIHTDGNRAYVLTCKHVVGGKGTTFVIFPRSPGERYQARFVAADQRADLAILETAAHPSTPAVAIAEAAPPVGGAVWQVGYPKGAGPVQRSAKVVSYRDFLTGRPRDFCLSYQSIEGDSGSGVFDAGTGALCGVNWGKPFDGTYQAEGYGALAVELADIRPFVETCLPGFRRPKQPAYPPAPTPAAAPPAYPPAANDPEFQKLKQEFQRLLLEVSQLRAAAGRPGPPGPPGPAGEPGRPGERGPAGESPDVSILLTELQALRRDIEAAKAKPPAAADDSARRLVLYFTSKDHPACVETDAAIESLKARGVPVVVTTLAPRDAGVQGVPRIFLPFSDRHYVGARQVLQFLAGQVPP